MTTDLKVGDIVKLKTGGPKMTVNRVGPYATVSSDETSLLKDEVETTWFAPRWHGTDMVAGVWEYVGTQRFAADALEKVNP